MLPKVSSCTNSLNMLAEGLKDVSAESDCPLRLISNAKPIKPEKCYAPEQLKHTESVFMQALLLSIQTGKPLLLEQHELEEAREWIGILCEGSALGLALLDHVTPWKRNRWQSFVSSEGAKHIYVAYIALGMAQAYLKQPILERLNDLDAMWKWLVIDGYGFHHGYSQAPNFLYKRGSLKGLNDPAAKKAFYQGLGRSLWFIANGNVEKIIKLISLHKNTHQQDLWTGIGIAAAYAGGVSSEGLAKLGLASGKFRPALCQGTAFAAMVRSQSDSQAAHTEKACQIICRLSAQECAQIASQALTDLPTAKNEEPYETWRRRIREYFA